MTEDELKTRALELVLECAASGKSDCNSVWSKFEAIAREAEAEERKWRVRVTEWAEPQRMTREEAERVAGELRRRVHRPNAEVVPADEPLVPWQCACVIEGGGRIEGVVVKACSTHLSWSARRERV